MQRVVISVITLLCCNSSIYIDTLYASEPTAKERTQIERVEPLRIKFALPEKSMLAFYNAPLRYFSPVYRGLFGNYNVYDIFYPPTNIPGVTFIEDRTGWSDDAAICDCCVVRRNRDRFAAKPSEIDRHKIVVSMPFVSDDFGSAQNPHVGSIFACQTLR